MVFLEGNITPNCGKLLLEVTLETTKHCFLDCSLIRGHTHVRNLLETVVFRTCNYHRKLRVDIQIRH